MPAKRVALAPIIEVPEEKPGHTVTDSMTLLVYDKNGEVQHRVKEFGISGQSVSSSANVTAAPEPPVSDSPAIVPFFNKIRFEDLRLLEELGRGSQGRVRKVQHKETKELYAMKTIRLEGDSEGMRQTLHQELERIAAIKHTYIVSSYEAYFRESKLYVLMELMDAGTMRDVLKRRGAGMPAARLAFVARDFFDGLHHLHASDILHRDIKPGNLLGNSKGEIKISDFGVAGTGSQRLHETGVGSTPYMSPERVRSEPYTMLCDIWSAGITVAELAIGSYPFGECKSDIYKLIEKLTDYKAVPSWEAATGEVTADLKDFVRMCMLPVDGPEPRPSAATLLTHRFLTATPLPTREDMGAWLIDPTRP